MFVITPHPNPHLRFVFKQCFKTRSGEGTPSLAPYMAQGEGWDEGS